MSRLRMAPAAFVLSLVLGHASAARGAPNDDAARVLGDPAYQTELPRPRWSGGGESFGGGSFPSLSFGGGQPGVAPGPPGGPGRQPNVDDSWDDGRGPPGTNGGDGSGRLDLGGGSGDGSGSPGGDGPGSPGGDGPGSPGGDGPGSPGGDGSGSPGGDGSAVPGGGTDTGGPSDGEPGSGSRPPEAGSGDGPTADGQPPARSARRHQQRREVVPAPSAPSAGQEVASTFAIAFLAVVVAGVLLYIVSKLLQARGKLAEEEAVVEEETATDALDVPRDPNVAEQLAAEGRFDEAVHVLLVCALERLSKRGEQPLSDHLTSREILRHVSAGSTLQGALTELVRVVEASLFGGATLSRVDYDRCLSSFRVVTEAS